MTVTNSPKIRFWRAIPAPDARAATTAMACSEYSNVPAYLKMRCSSSSQSNSITRKRGQRTQYAPQASSSSLSSSFGTSVTGSALTSLSAEGTTDAMSFSSLSVAAAMVACQWGSCSRSAEGQERFAAEKPTVQAEGDGASVTCKTPSVNLAPSWEVFFVRISGGSGVVPLAGVTQRRPRDARDPNMPRLCYGAAKRQTPDFIFCSGIAPAREMSTIETPLTRRILGMESPLADATSSTVPVPVPAVPRAASPLDLPHAKTFANFSPIQLNSAMHVALARYLPHGCAGRPLRSSTDRREDTLQPRGSLRTLSACQDRVWCQPRGEGEREESAHSSNSSIVGLPGQ